MTHAHADRAIATLATFDAVLVLETLDRSFDQLFARLGWCKPPKHELRQSFGPGDEAIEFAPDEERRLRAINAPDLRVYAFARELAAALEAALPADARFTACRAKRHRRVGGNGNPLD